MLLFREASKFQAYDEFPVLRPEVDPQLHVSRSDHAQPFYLVLEKDCVLIVTTGKAALLLRHDEIRCYNLVPGDFVYIPAGTPHRLLPHRISITLRYKAKEPGIEALVWYCERCDAMLDRFAWDTRNVLSQEGYEQGVARFNDRPAARLCDGCGWSAPVIDTGRYRWREIAQALRAEQVAENSSLDAAEESNRCDP